MIRGALVQARRLKAQLAAAGTVLTANSKQGGQDLELSGFRELVITLDVTAADRTDGDETYDFYIQMGDGTSSWDIVHFPQIASSGAKRYTARVLAERLAEVTTATPGVAAEPAAIMKTDTAGSNEGTGTLIAGKVRHGPFADLINYELKVSGTTPSVTFGITITAS